MPSKAALARPRDKSLAFPDAMIRGFLREEREPGTGKSQHRVVLKPQPIQFAVDDKGTLCDVGCLHVEGDRRPRITLGRVITLQELPYAVGDRIVAREAWTHEAADLDELRAKVEDTYPDFSYGPHYRATEPAPETLRWRSPTTMPRWASRLTLLVTEVRVERLQSISTVDAMAEGVVQTWGDWRGDPPAWALREGETESHFYDNRTSRENFALLWNSLHGPDAWAANPFVVVLTLRPTLANIDALPAEADLRREVGA